MTSQNLDQQPLKSLEINGETFFKIEKVDTLRPFFMSIVSAYNHWMFLGSNGGITAGRKNAEYALFPYYTDDKIIESTEITGCKTIVQLTQNQKKINWEPFSNFGNEKFNLERNLYKNRYGNKVAFEEINHDLKLSFRYEWNSTNKYGFLRTATLTNSNTEPIKIELIDGLQNIIPFGVGSDLQNKQSNLVDAYKRNELDVESGLGIYALSAIIVDRAEPSEALKANVVWHKGLNKPKYLVSSKQLIDFKKGLPIEQEDDIKAEKGAYMVHSAFTLNGSDSTNWHLVANVNQNHSAVIGLINAIKTETDIIDSVKADVDEGTQELIKLTATADGLQQTADLQKDVRHFANTMFNIMRGGVFDHNYQIERWEIEHYLKQTNIDIYEKHKSVIAKLNSEFSLFELEDVVVNSNDTSFKRLIREYLPLKFSRRHGDPSRPWNKFSINTQNEDDGSKILDYQGNWRDIFQNWEALAFAYPEFIEGMIYRFLNASTFDGYNPYRIMKYGFDWETIEPNDPWSFIGYWGDHQIIYLLKFLEFYENHKPGQLNNLLSKRNFAYAAVPYRIKAYNQILENPKDTIEFDYEWDAEIRLKREKTGSDGALLKTSNGYTYHVSFIEKILATTLAKIANYIPDAGIWMNTQRPEWNDANNALVGNGVSMVTLYYLRRFLSFFSKLLDNTNQQIEISKELYTCYSTIKTVFEQNQTHIAKGFNGESRKNLMDALGTAASEFRTQVYNNGFSAETEVLNTTELNQFYQLVNQFLEQSIESNERADGLYHSYNIIEIEKTKVEVNYLSEMLEGQVAVLSSGYLNAIKANNLLNSLQNSKLYRKDQNSYILYPNKELKGFLDRNNVPLELITTSELLKALVAKNNVQVIEKDINGNYHFNGYIRNKFELDIALNKLDQNTYGSLINKDRQLVLDIYETVFNHKEFTGRSGTFYGYEGLGSIYWHMVSKLLLAVEENVVAAKSANTDKETLNDLKLHFNEVLDGIGAHKSPKVYGAFSTDPYSHTPFTKGAQQPGMTGQVKEDIISRFGELGVKVFDGKIQFAPLLLTQNELIKPDSVFNYFDIEGNNCQVKLPSNSLAFTYCQVPVVYTLADSAIIKAYYSNGKTEKIEGSTCTKEISKALFARNGEIEKIEVGVAF